MALPNGPGSLLTAGQQALLGQTVGTTKKLFQGAEEKILPERQLAKQQLAELKIKSKLRPSASDVAKLAGMNSLGFLYLGDTISKTFGGDSSPAKLEGNFLQNIFGEDSLLSTLFTFGGSTLAKGLGKKFAPKLTGFLTSAAGPVAVGVASAAALIGSIVMTGNDVKKGSKKAKEWGVSKFTAGLAAGLGGTSKGVKGMTHGAIKGALGGAGIGGLGALLGTFVFPGVGTAVGGLIGAGIGAAVGAVTGGALGHRGGERIAKDFAKADDWIKKNVFAPIGKLGTSLLASASSGALKLIGVLDKTGRLEKLWASDESLGKKVLGSLGVAASGIGSFMGRAAEGIKDFAAKVTTNDDGTKNLLGKALDGVKAAAMAVPEFLKGGLDKLGSFIVGEEKWTDIKTFFDDKIFGGIKSFFEGVGSWIKKLFGLQEESEEEIERRKWEKKFKRSKTYLELEEQQRNATLEGRAFDFDMQSAIDAAWEKEKASRTKVEDATFSLERALSKGSLFANSSGVDLHEDDDLYLMASTNPARDALTSSVNRLNELISELAVAIQSYRPQTNNATAMIQNSSIPLNDLIALPSRG